MGLLKDSFKFPEPLSNYEGGIAGFNSTREAGSFLPEALQTKISPSADPALEQHIA